MAKSDSNHITSCTISWENTKDLLIGEDNCYFF